MRPVLLDVVLLRPPCTSRNAVGEQQSEHGPRTRGPPPFEGQDA